MVILKEMWLHKPYKIMDYHRKHILFDQSLTELLQKPLSALTKSVKVTELQSVQSSCNLCDIL